MVASSVNVLVRARPLSQSEIDSGSEVILKMEKHKTFLNYIKDDKDDTTHRRESFSQKQFLFDRSYWSVDTSDEHFSDQCQIFNEYGKNVIKSAIDGYNACVFAYGQTGSGKTYTMMGTPNDLGIIPRICEGLFKQLIKMRAENITSRLEVSFMEIYNEQVHDLLQRKPKMFGQTATHSLKVREHPKEGPFVQDLSIHPVTDYSSVEALIDQGNSLRITAGTKMNALSSRSHSIFTLKMTQAKFCGNIPSETVSKVHLVDLAGSERIAKSGMTGIRLKEGANINKSLTTLGLVISALAENSSTQKSTGKIPRRQAFVPYRDSVLTWLLKDSIGGNSKTIMIATVSPSQIHYSETLSTLRYASRARKIVNKPIINEDPNVKTIRELRSEIEKLRKMLQDNTFEGPLTGKSKKVEAKLKENEEKVDKLTKHWLNKITEAQRIFKEKAMTLSQQGHQTVLTSAKPHLVGLEVDPLSTDIVIYHLEEGRTVIGSCNLSDEQGIALEGSGIAQEHCDLTVSRERVILHSIAGPTYINNTLVQQDWDLRQGDVLQFGHFLKFRFHNPIEAAALREKRRSGLFSQTASGRMSPAVMLHYRSLDSGLSSPDDFDQDFDQSQETEQVLNSTAASNNETPLNQRKMSEELQAPYRDVASDVTDRHNVVLRKDDDMKDDDMKDVKPSDVVVRRRKQFLKSASASDVLSKSLSVANATSDGNISFQLNSTKCSEIYLSADNLLSRRHTKKERDRHHFDILSSPSSVKHASSGSDLSLSTDDLAFNLMLQSQIRSTSSMSSLSGKGGKDRQSYPSLDNHTQSMWELSPRKYEEQNDDGDMFHCESLSVLHRRSFNGEEIIVHPDTSGSFLAREAKDAADLLKSRREQLKKLIEEYRSAEISRVEVEKENMRRGKDNEQIFAKQQSHLEDLIQQQHIRLNEAKFELREFQNLVSSEKQKQRENVEREVDHLMNLKQDHLPFLDWSEHELRKKKFKLKVKIEDYWKRMDLYETLWMELELERNQVKRDTDEKLQEKIKQFELQQTAEMNGLRDEIQRRQASVDTYTAQLEEQTAKQTQLSSDIASIDVDYTTKIREAERFRSDVKAQEATMLNECQLEIEELENEITKEKEKKFKYTIYNMHECDSPSCSSEHHEYAGKELNCKLTEEKQQVVLDKLSLRKDELETKYNKKVDKYNLMLQNADHALAELREDHIVTVETKKQEIVYKKDLINKLENELKSETEECRNLKNELKAFERPRSFISDCPEESEEDIIANEQQIEQLLQSKEKVCKTLEASLEKQFKELKEKRVLNGKEPLSGGETTTTAVDHALSLVLHAGNSSAYAESLVNKHTQYENRKKTLLNINNDLQDLMKYQMALHREVAENFLEQKSLFEEVRSQERKDIHDTIQTLISENTDDNDELLSRIFNESERIIAYQQKLDMLENQMYEKITQNHELQSKLDEIQEKLAEKSLGKQSTSENPKGGDPLPTIGNEIALTEEFDVIRTEKRKCEQLISELQQKLFEERKEYLELLKSKDDYDVIGPEYRDERRTMFQTEGNKAAAEILREIFMIGNLLDGMAKNPLSSDPTCGGWKYISVEKNVQIFKKKIEKTGAVSVLGRGIIKASPKLVWETVRNPLSRLIYDKMVKKMNVIENFTDQLKVVYFQHHARLFLLKHKKDCCCVHSERIEKNKYIASYRSVEHPDCPEKKNYSRLQIQPSGWVLEPHTENGEDWCLAWYVLQVDAGKGYIPSYFIDSLVQKLPLSISSLRDYLVLS